MPKDRKPTKRPKSYNRDGWTPYDEYTADAVRFAGFIFFSAGPRYVDEFIQYFEDKASLLSIYARFLAGVSDPEKGFGASGELFLKSIQDAEAQGALGRAPEDDGLPRGGDRGAVEAIKAAINGNEIQLNNAAIRQIALQINLVPYVLRHLAQSLDLGGGEERWYLCAQWGLVSAPNVRLRALYIGGMYLKLKNFYAFKKLRKTRADIVGEIAIKLKMKKRDVNDALAIDRELNLRRSEQS